MIGGRTEEAKKARNIVSSASEESEDEFKETRSKAIAKRRSRTSSRRSSIASSQHHEKHYVEHNYHDHLCDPIEPEETAIPQNPTEIAARKKRSHRGGVAVPFPEKLHYMLGKMDEEENTGIVAWQPHGRCFTVHKPKEFVEEIMPRYFKQTKLTSFQRQLNLYGFSRLTAGQDRGGYYHELFIRGRMDLCRRMVRTRVKGNGSKAASSPSTEPNFYAMPACTEKTSRLVGGGGSSYTASEETSDKTRMVSSGSDDLVDTAQKEAEESSLKMILTEAPFAATVTTLADGGNGAHTTPPMSPVIEPAKLFNPCPPISLPVSFPNLPIVSPCERKTLISAPSCPQLLASLCIPEERDLSSPLVEMHEDIHSGDQVYFEGLPFHYLETKDVEDNLLAGQ